jgi:excisionase family DNA binding protein
MAEVSEWMSAEEAAAYVGLSSSALYALAQKGRIPRQKIGKVWRFSRADLDSWVRANTPIEEFFTTVPAFIEDNDLLRDPQREAHAAAVAFFDGGGKQAIIQIPVGCGKSALIAILPFGIAQGRVLVISPGLTIREGLASTLDVTNKRNCAWSKFKVLPPETLSAGPFRAVLDGKDANISDCLQSHIVLANIQQLASSADKWLPQFPDDFFDLILVDEGHRSPATSWQKVFTRFPNAKVVNLTATPFRADQKEITGELIYRYSFRRAMAKGYIKRLKATYVAPDEISFTYEGDKHRHTLEEVLELREEEWFSRGVALAPECNKHIVDASLDKLEKLRATGTRHQLIAVAMQVNHAKAIRSLYAERGFEADVIYAEMPEDKKAAVLQKLRAGLLDCIVQVRMLGEGFDHPPLSVAAIFRPFRTLSPYVQFVGRIMRAIVQNDPRHPDNCGDVVTHVGMNLDRLLAEFQEMDRDDKKFFADLITGEEPEVPPEVREGKARMKLGNEMVVQNEIVSSFFEENFLDPDDEVLRDELRAHAESLGLDGEALMKALASLDRPKRSTKEAAAPFAVQPQNKRKELKKRLNEEARRAAKLLLNRVGLDAGAADLRLTLFPGRVTGANFVAAVQLVFHELKKVNGGRELKALDDKELEAAMAALTPTLDSLTRQIKAAQAQVEKDKEQEKEGTAKTTRKKRKKA